MEMDFEQLYNTYYMQVYSFVLALSRNRDISEEITQKTFFRAITAGKKYAGNSSELTAVRHCQEPVHRRAATAEENLRCRNRGKGVRHQRGKRRHERGFRISDTSGAA